MDEHILEQYHSRKTRDSFDEITPALKERPREMGAERKTRWRGCIEIGERSIDVGIARVQEKDEDHGLGNWGDKGISDRNREQDGTNKSSDQEIKRRSEKSQGKTDGQEK